MARPSDWWILDLDRDPTPGVVESVQALAKQFHDFADDAEQAWRNLNSFGGDAAALAWIGQTADAFKSNFGPLPDRMKKLYTSYREAGAALDAYWPKLQSAQTKADNALRDGRDAHDDVQRLDGQVKTAAATLKSAQTGTDQNAISDAQHAHDNAQTSLNDAHSRLNTAKHDANQAHDDRISAAKECAQALHHASSDGIHNKHWWEHVGEFLSEVGGEIADIAGEIAPILDIIALATSWIPGVDVITAALAEAANIIALVGTVMKIAGDGMQGHWGDALLGAGMLGLQFVGGKLIEKYGGKIFEKIAARGNKDAITAGDPVDVVSGQMLTGDVDLALPGVLPLALRRSYASAYPFGRLFGPGWASFLDQRISINAAGLHFVGDDAQLLDYPLPAPGGASVLPMRGAPWPLEWDREADEIRITDPTDGIVRHFAVVHHSEEAGQIRDLTAMSDRMGNRIDVLRTEDGTPIAVELPGYRVAVDTVVTASGVRVARLRLQDGTEDGITVRSFGYDERGRLTDVVDAAGRPFRYEHDDADRITAWIDRNGVSYRYEYDQTGRVVRGASEGVLLATSFAYDDETRTTTVTDSLGHPTQYRHDEHGHLDRITDAFGGVRELRSDPRGHLLRQVDQLGHVTEFERDERGNPLSVTQPDGAVTRVAYDDFDQPVELTAPDGAVWRYEYDDRGLLTAITDPCGAVTRFQRDGHGRPLAAMDALGAVQRYRCDEAGLPVEITGPAGGVVRSRRDAFGRIVELVDALGAVTVIERDALGRPVRETAPDGTVQRWDYDAEGNLLAYTTPAGAVTRFEYGPFDKLTARTEPDGARYTFHYDSELRLTSVTGPTGLTWQYEHDALGNLVAERDFDGTALTYRLDAAGRLVARTDSGGRTVTFIRDARGRVIERYAGDEIFRYAYDAAGRLREAVGGGSTLTYEHDAAGRITAETVDGRSVVNVYDATGRRTERITPTGVRTRWGYDAAGRHESMAGNVGALRFRYDAAGQETLRLLGPGATLSQSYDVVGRPLVQGVWSYPGQDAGSATPAVEPTALQTRSVGYRADGVPIEVRDALRGTSVYRLDAAGRVTAVEAASWREAYAYDALGNLSGASTPAADANEQDGTEGGREYQGTRIRQDRRTTYEHDAAGRLVRKVRRTLSGGRKTWSYAWDADGRRAGFTGPDGDTWSYAYDPLGRRVAKTRLAADGTAAETVRFSWDGPRVAEEHRVGPDGLATTLTWDYEPGGFRPVAQTRRSWAADAPQDRIDEEFHAIIADAVGTPLELVTPDGRLAWHTTRSLFGQRITAPESTVDCPLGFPGQYWDDESGLYYNVYRYYDPETGAYLSPDPLGFAPADNNAAYVANPLVESDPLGLFGCPVGIQNELAGMRGQMNMKSVAQEDAAAAALEAQGKRVPTGTRNTLGKMEFDGGRDPIYGYNGRIADRTAAFPGPGNSMLPQSFVEHAEGDMVYQAGQRGYTGGNAVIHTDRATCGFCKSSIKGYVKMLNLDSITVYDPNGLVGVWDATGKIA